MLYQWIKNTNFLVIISFSFAIKKWKTVVMSDHLSIPISIGIAAQTRAWRHLSLFISYCQVWRRNKTGIQGWNNDKQFFKKILCVNLCEILPGVAQFWGKMVCLLVDGHCFLYPCIVKKRRGYGDGCFYCRCKGKASVDRT